MYKVTKINMTKEERLQTLEQRIAEERRALEELEPYITTLTDNLLCKNIASKVSLYWHNKYIVLSIYNYDMATVIDHVCGPFHRTYGVDWTCEIPYEGMIKLKTRVCQNPEEESKWRKKYIEVYIDILEQSMQSCSFIRVPVRRISKEEREVAIRAALETFIYENRIDCSGE